VNTEIAPSLPALGGKTIAHIVLKKGSSPTGQLFLVFTDGTYYEFYSGSPIDGTTSFDGGGLAAAIRYMAPRQRIVFQC
jgi:uncharacterized SAM-binding protein YcdF (DUF218 family)